MKPEGNAEFVSGSYKRPPSRPAAPPATACLTPMSFTMRMMQ